MMQSTVSYPGHIQTLLDPPLLQLAENAEGILGSQSDISADPLHPANSFSLL